MMDVEDVAVRVLEDRLVAYAAVDRVSPERDAAGLQLRASGSEVVHPERDRGPVGTELLTQGVHLDNGDGEFRC